MNFKTTFFLAISLLVVLVLLLVASRYDKREAERELASPSNSSDDSGLEKRLFDNGIGVVESLTIHQRDAETWAFQKTQSGWSILEPVAAEAASSYINQTLKQIENLRYSIVYKPGEGLEEREAGLKYPQAEVSMTNAEGKTYHLRIGTNANDLSGYVQKEAGGDIYLVNRSVKGIVQDDIGKYRDPMLVSFDPSKVDELCINLNKKGTVTRWVLKRTDSGWAFTEPFEGEAIAEKVNTLLHIFSHVKVSRWIAQMPESIVPFGVEQPAILLQATMENSTGSTTDSPTHSDYDLRISALSPIDNERLIYAMSSTSPSIAVIPINLLEVLLPKMNEWRDMRMVTQPIASAEQIDLVNPEGSSSIRRRGLDWTLDDGTPISTAEINTLLHELGSMSARSFVYKAGDEQAFGLGTPRAQWTIHAPRLPSPVTISIGEYADPDTKRLVYVQVGNTIGKVMARDIASALLLLADFRDRSIFSLNPDDILSLSVTKPNPVLGGTLNWAASRVSAQTPWELTSPESMVCDSASVNTLVSTLANLNGIDWIASDADPKAYGLNEPDVRVDITWRPESTYRLIEDEASTNGKLIPEEYQPEDEVFTLVASQEEDTCYARRLDREAVYTIPVEVCESMQQNYFISRFFSFRTDEVQAVSVTTPDGQRGLAKVNDHWQWTAEPDIPINDKAVRNYLVRLSDLQYDQLAGLGTDDSLHGAYSVSLTTPDGVQTLFVSEVTCDTAPGEMHYAWLDGQTGIYLVSANIIRRFELNLAEFEQMD